MRWIEIRHIRYILVIGTIVAMIVAIIFLFVKPRGSEPLLSGPPEFIFFAIIVAFAAFLRQLSLHATDLRDKIFHDEIWNFPPDKGYARDKMAEADKTSDAIRTVTPFMILMILLVCARIVCDSIVRIVCVPKGDPPHFL